MLDWIVVEQETVAAAGLVRIGKQVSGVLVAWTWLLGEMGQLGWQSRGYGSKLLCSDTTRWWPRGGSFEMGKMVR